MPRFKTHDFKGRNAQGGYVRVRTVISIDAKGNFYCAVPSEVGDLYPEIKHNDYKVFEKTFDALVTNVQKMLDDFNTPTVTESLVILYNIESHVCFAELPDKTIVPSGAWKGAVWNSSDAYGGHHSASPCKRGYSLIIGAKAMTKTTTKYGDRETHTYDYYYGKKGDHFSTTDPASILNSWCALALPPRANEIPYSDEAALFFHNLILRMVEMSRAVQGFVGDQETLITLIEQGQRLPFNEGINL